MKIIHAFMIVSLVLSSVGKQWLPHLKNSGKEITLYVFQH